MNTQVGHGYAANDFTGDSVKFQLYSAVSISKKGVINVDCSTLNGDPQSSTYSYDGDYY